MNNLTIKKERTFMLTIHKFQQDQFGNIEFYK